MSISLCAVVFNESNRIEEFVNYHRKFFSEILVINQGSTDDTQAKLDSLGVRSIYDDNQGLAEPSRHIAALNTKNDWILFLDADERITDEFAARLPELCSGEYDGYILERSNYLDGQLLGKETNQYRLFKKQYVAFKNVLHGAMLPRHGSRIGTVENAIVHTKNSEEHAFDHNTYAEIILKTPEAVSPLWYNHYLARTFPIENLITFVVTTSAKHENPDITHIEQLFASYEDKFGIGKCPKILVADGFNKERNINNKSYNALGLLDEDKYIEYKKRLAKFCEARGILFLTPEQNLYMDGAILHGTNRVSTPYYLYTQDDIVAVKQVDLKSILEGMSSNLIIKRLNFHNYDLVEDSYNDILKQVTHPFPCVKTSNWSSNTHVGYTHHMNYVYGPIIRSLNRYPLENTINVEFRKKIAATSFDQAHSFYGTYIYGTKGDSRYVDHDFSYMKELELTTARFHSFDFPDGTWAKGVLSRDVLNHQFALLGEIDFKDKTVLDVGCWDGYYSIRASQAGASFVTGIDIDPWGKTDWMTNFVEARRKFGISNIDILRQNLYDLPDDKQYDIVLFMGVLYHLQNPLGALQKMRAVTREKLVLETLIDVDDLPYPALKFYPGKEMANDPTNWFGPNKLWVESALKVAGFENVQLVSTISNRAVFHAW